MQDVMIDVETLDTRPSAVLLSIAAVRFDVEEDVIYGDMLHVHVDIDSCLAAGRTVSGSTIMWWLDQSDEARSKLVNAPRHSLREALTMLSEFITPEDRVWGNGASFDNAIMADAYRSLGMPQPWRYWGDMCYRTLKNVHSDIKKPPFTGTKHDALADAINQATHLQMIFKSLREKAPTT